MEPRYSSIVIIGSTGFIGKTLFIHFRESERSAYGASSKECNLLSPLSVRTFFKNIPDNATLVFCSVINRRFCTEFSALLKNIEMAENFAEAVRAKQVRSVCYLSSIDVYGKFPHLPITELTLPEPLGYYALSKYCCECILRSRLQDVCPCTILRLPGVYGHGDNGQSIIGRFVRSVLQSDTISLTGGGTALRDYLEVSDLCQIVAKVCEEPFNGLLNVATGRSLSVKSIVQAIASKSGIVPRIEECLVDESAAGDLIFDVASLQAHFSHSFTSIEEGISRYISTLRKH